MRKSTELDYLRNAVAKAESAVAKPKSYAAFYLDAARELHIYEARDLFKLKAVMDDKHPEYELVHAEGYPDGSTSRNLAAAAKQIRDIRLNVLRLAVVNTPVDFDF